MKVTNLGNVIVLQAETPAEGMTFASKPDFSKAFQVVQTEAQAALGLSSGGTAEILFDSVQVLPDGETQVTHQRATARDMATLQALFASLSNTPGVTVTHVGPFGASE